MPEPPPPTLNRLPRWLPGGQRWLRPSGPLRMRLAMYLAFALLALVVVVQAMLTLRVQDARHGDAMLLDRLGALREAVLRVGGQTVLPAAADADRAAQRAALRPLLTQLRAESSALDDLLMRRRPLPGDGTAGVDAGLQGWRQAHGQLLDRAEQWLRLGEGAGAAETPAAWGAAARDLRRDTERALQAAQGLSAAMLQAAELRTERLRSQVQWGSVAVLGLLALLALAVVEPAARAVARQLRRADEQSAQVRHLALVAEHTTALVIISDAQDRVQWVNGAFTRICGWTPAEALGRRPRELLSHPHEDLAVRAGMERALQRGESLRCEWLRRARDGRDLWLDIDLSPVRDDAGQTTGFVRVATDVTARAQQQAKFQALWAALPAGVVVQATSGEVVDGNRAAERMLGLAPGELVGMTLQDPRLCAVREDASPITGHDHPVLRTLRSGQALSNQTIGVHTTAGELRWLLLNTEPQRDAQGQMVGVVTCFIDITESRQLQQQLHSHARTDALTQLPNRSVVSERLQRAIQHAQRHPGYGFAVLFMDFDRFKQVNDTLGHGAGDELLRQVAQRLQDALRPGDAVARLETLAPPQPALPPHEAQQHVAARIGGDEFVVVLDGVVDATALSAIAARLLCDLSEPYLLGSTPVQSSVSIGVVLYRAEPGQDSARRPGLEAQAETLLRNADTAMYEAKRAGRGRWVLFDDSMHERVVRALAVETDLRQALKDDDLFVVYQPVVDLVSRAAVGVEALVRWRHPQRGLVSPVEFIGVAEECGLIDAVGEAVLRKACGQFVQWRHTLGEAAPQQLAVNLSRAQLTRAALVDDVRHILQATAMPPERLQLEVTESLAAQDERVQSNLRELKKLGLKLALDDFGTGYSSLACLHLMPVDTVKVDRSFVRHAETVEYHRVLIEATIRVARTLGMTTVAEGIETEGQAALMQQLQCDRGQGFLFARPLVAAELEAWARSRHDEASEVMGAD